MTYFHFKGEAYNVDRIVSIEKTKNFITIKMLKDWRHDFFYTDNSANKLLKDYDELIKAYNEALVKRKEEKESKDYNPEYDKTDEYGTLINVRYPFPDETQSENNSGVQQSLFD